MGKSKWRGLEIECIIDVWIYSDNKKLVSDNKNRKCGHCNKENTKKGHDGCIGELPDVLNACCGHGTVEEAYIQFPDKTELRGIKALQHIENRQKNDLIFNKLGRIVSK